jgi:hypothetical protein
MKRIICLSLACVLGLFLFMTPARAFDITGWWTGKATYQQGDFVTGDWTSLRAAGKKASYLYIFQDTSTTGTGFFLIWDDLTSDYLLETYNLFVKNNIVVLYVPTFFDPTTGAPAAATLVLKPVGSASNIISMSGFYTLYDMEATSTPDLFVRMGGVVFNHVMVDKVPALAKEKVPFP